MTGSEKAPVRPGGVSAAGGWRDDPIQTVEQDQLRRAPFAEHAARLIHENHTNESSVVYGLEGPWGSGKSSVIALITTFLTERPDSRWQVVPFTPWATSGTEGLLAEFFAALGTVGTDPDGKKGLRSLITSYADIARPLAAMIPVVGPGLAEATRTLEARLAKPWNVAFDELSAELRKLDTPVLVVVDDIDRLQPAELLDLLKVVRLLGRFPGVDFLLAYDEQTLIETLQDRAHGGVSKARARAFMEKIVQYPLSIPPLLTSKIVRMLTTGLTEILTLERVETGFERHRFGDVLLSAMPSQLATPRAIERFLAQVREQVRMHDLEEMNDADLILATFLRVQFPDLFAQLQRWKAELTRAASTSLALSHRDDTPQDWEPLLGTVDEEQNRSDARAVLEAIFPAVGGKVPSRAKPGRFAHPDYFDRYLAQTIPEGDIPDSVIARALAQAAAGDDGELRALVMADDDEQVTLALSKIRARYPDIGYDQGDQRGPATLDLLAAGMALVDEAEDRLDSWVSPGLQLTYWMADLLRLILAADPAAAIDPALVTCTHTQRRAHVISTASRDLESVGENAAVALRDALNREIERILPLLIDDLRQGDESPEEPGMGLLYELIADSPQLDKLKGEITNGLEAGEFTLEDVAARLVGVAYVVGGSGRPSGASFSGTLFTKITGVEAGSARHLDTTDWTDASWARRRQFASQFIAGPRRSDQA